MKLCIRGYYSALETHGKMGIWNILPKYFHENKEEMEQTTNSLQNFLKSGKVVFEKKLYIPMKVFSKHLMIIAVKIIYQGNSLQRIIYGYIYK